MPQSVRYHKLPPLSMLQPVTNHAGQATWRVGSKVYVCWSVDINEFHANTGTSIRYRAAFNSILAALDHKLRTISCRLPSTHFRSTRCHLERAGSTWFKRLPSVQHLHKQCLLCLRGGQWPSLRLSTGQGATATLSRRPTLPSERD